MKDAYPKIRDSDAFQWRREGLSKDGIGRLQHHNLLLLRATTGGALIPTFNYLRDAALRTPRSQQLSSMEVITDTSRNAGMKNGVLIAPTILGTTKDWGCWLQELLILSNSVKRLTWAWFSTLCCSLVMGKAVEKRAVVTRRFSTIIVWKNLSKLDVYALAVEHILCKSIQSFPITGCMAPLRHETTCDNLYLSLFCVARAGDEFLMCLFPAYVFVSVCLDAYVCLRSGEMNQECCRPPIPSFPIT